MANLTGTEIAQLAYQAGFRGEDLVNVVAIAKRESKYNPKAFNGNTGTGDKSYGLMQINMLGSMGPARMKAFGITSEDQLYDPLTNMKAAFTLYKGSGNKLTPWGGYKGQANTYSTNVEEARKVVNAAGASGALGKDFVASQAGTAAAGDQAVSNLSDADINAAAAQYGYAAAYLNDPEIGPILRDAARHGWSDAKLEAAIKSTNWYRTSTASQRTFQMLAAADPAEAQRQIGVQQSTMADQASKLGLHIDPARMKEMAYQSLAFGWNQNQIGDALAAELKYSPEQAAQGQIGAQTADVKTLAGKYYLNMSDETAFNYAKAIAAGQLDMGGLEATFKNQAKGKFSTLAAQIDAGITPQDFFDPYKQEISKLLDIPAAAIDLVNDPKWSQVLSTQGQDGKLRPMTISEVQTMARNTPEWNKTAGAKASAAQFGEMLTKTFGAVG